MGAGTLGPRVIGEEQFEAEQGEVKRIGSHLGPRVLGARLTGEDPEEVAEVAKAAAVPTRPEGDEIPDPVQASALDRLLTDAHEGYVEAAPGELELGPVAAAEGYATLEEMEAALGEDPALVDQALALELQRESPRKGGLRLILRTEEGREEPREDFVAAVTEALETL